MHLKKYIFFWDPIHVDFLKIFSKGIAFFNCIFQRDFFQRIYRSFRCRTIIEKNFGIKNIIFELKTRNSNEDYFQKGDIKTAFWKILLKAHKSKFF